MRTLHRSLAAFGLAGALCAGAWPACAAPLTPTADGQVVEVLPTRLAARSEEQALRRRLATHPMDAEAAVALAQSQLQQARRLGDARFAGRALGTLTPWGDPAKSPDAVLMMLATVQQYLHAFDAATANLERLVQRNPLHAQGWLTLATVRRVQGRYAASDAACQAIGRAGQAFYAQACTAENDSLRGAQDAARDGFQRLLAAPGLGADSRAWLTVSLAELETRAGRPAQAETHYRAALAAAADDDYARLGLVDLLLAAGRAEEALRLTDTMARSDTVLVRRAIAARRAGTAEAKADAMEMRARMAQADQRRQLEPAASAGPRTHGREQAMFALWVENQPAQALTLARENLTLQREPIDLLVFVQAARAAGHQGALQEARKIEQDMGLHDARLALP